MQNNEIEAEAARIQRHDADGIIQIERRDEFIHRRKIAYDGNNHRKNRRIVDEFRSPEGIFRYDIRHRAGYHDRHERARESQPQTVADHTDHRGLSDLEFAESVHVIGKQPAFRPGKHLFKVFVIRFQRT